MSVPRLDGSGHYIVLRGLRKDIGALIRYTEAFKQQSFHVRARLFDEKVQRYSETVGEEECSCSLQECLGRGVTGRAYTRSVHQQHDHGPEKVCAKAEAG